MSSFHFVSENGSIQHKKAKIEDELQSGVYDWIFLGKEPLNLAEIHGPFGPDGRFGPDGPLGRNKTRTGPSGYVDP